MALPTGGRGLRATVIDLYELVARQRGLAATALPLTSASRSAARSCRRCGRASRPQQAAHAGVTSSTSSTTTPDWPRQFERWAKVLRGCLGETARRIEHGGSTSVPGLPAKPVIDIQVSVTDLDDEARDVPPLQQVGVQLRSRDELHRYLRPFPGQPRNVHVHVCAADSTWEREHLLFRDHLRAYPQAHDAYATAKRKAAATWADDGIATPTPRATSSWQSSNGRALVDRPQMTVTATTPVGYVSHSPILHDAARHRYHVPRSSLLVFGRPNFRRPPCPSRMTNRSTPAVPQARSGPWVSSRRA